MPPSTAGETPAATRTQIEFEWPLEQPALPVLSSSAAELVAALELLEESVAAAKAKNSTAVTNQENPATMTQSELALFTLDLETAETPSTIDQQTKTPVEPDPQGEAWLAADFHTDAAKISDNGSESSPNLEMPSGREEQADLSSKQAPETEAQALATAEAETTTGRAMAAEKPPEPREDKESTGENVDRGLTPGQAAEDGGNLPCPAAADGQATDAPEVRWTIEPGSKSETRTRMPSVPDRLPRRRVLAIDDDPTIRKLLKMSLAPHNYDCVTAENGLAAQEALKSYRPDLILVDLLMPVMDGLAFLRWLREEARDPTPVIVFTNVNDGEMTRAALRSGANLYTNKPLHLKELLQAMQQLMPA